MSDTQPHPAGTGATGAEAAAALAEIQRRQGNVIKAVLVPAWYWWVTAAGIVAIGAARDTGNLVAQAITIPVAVLIVAGLTAAMIPAVRHRVEVHSATLPRGRAAAAIFGLVVLANAVILGAAIGLSAGRAAHPATIATAIGAAALVIAGPLVNRYLRKLMLSQARQHMNDAQTPEAASHGHGSLR